MLPLRRAALWAAAALAPCVTEADSWESNGETPGFLVSLSAYAAYFKLVGRWEQKLELRIDGERAHNITISVGRIVLGLVKLAAMLTGIVCSTGLVVVILFIGLPLANVLLLVLIGCVAFATQSVIDQLTAADEEYEEDEQVARMIASVEEVGRSPTP